MGDASQLYVEHVENIGIHYAETLRRWRLRFLANADAVRAQGFDERFVRMWEFYLAYCEGAFLARYINDLQLVLTRPMNGTLGYAAYGDAARAGPRAAPRGRGVRPRHRPARRPRPAPTRCCARDPHAPAPAPAHGSGAAGIEGIQERKRTLIDELRHSPVALATDEANDQHYEVPTELFELMLGPAPQVLVRPLASRRAHARRGRGGDAAADRASGPSSSTARTCSSSAAAGGR